MSAPIYVSPLSASPIAVDAADPNAAEPEEIRTFPGASGRDVTPTALYAVAVDGSITLQIWGYVAQLQRWFKVGSATACAADTVTALGTPPVGLSKLYAQVTVNTAGTRFALGYLGSR